MRLLISGGAGFIGSNLVHRLNALGYTNITIVDRLGRTDKWRNLVGLRYRDYIEVDDFVAILDSGKQPPFHVIFHLGACSSTRETDASYLIRNNYEWSRRILGFSLAIGARFIYASSAATYGAALSDDSLSPSLLRPLNPYALSKNMFDQYLESNGGLDHVVGLKYHNVFGPNSRHKGIMTDFVAKTYDAIKRDGYTTMYDTHLSAPEGVKDARDFLYVKDAIDMTLFFALDEKGRTSNGLFNIGSGQPASWREVAAHPFAALDKPVDIRYQPMPDDLRAKYQYYTCADIGKIRAAGYTGAITPLSDAIKDYVQTYLVPDKRRGEVTS